MEPLSAAARSFGGTSPPGPTGSSELAMRFICSACGVCIGTSDALVESRDDVISFSGLYSPEAGTASRTVICPGCSLALGTKGSGTFLLRRGRVVPKQEPLEILICSLKEQEMTDMVPIVQESFPHCNISTRLLLKAELRGFTISDQRPSPDLIVVVHRNEGRALLTDRNGFYHDVLGSAWQQTRGNVLVVLTKANPKADGDLFDWQMLRTLSSQGDQPTIGAISALGRVLTWEGMPSATQKRQIHKLTLKAYYREASSEATGIPSSWSRHPAGVAGSWCALL